MMDPRTALLQRYNWRTVTAPSSWKPEEVGEELVGYYGGRTIRDGQYGQYEVIIIHVPGDGAFMLTGVRVVQLIDASMAKVGDPVRVIWQGLKETGAGHKMKNYEVMVAEGEALQADHLPDVGTPIQPPTAEVRGNVGVQVSTQ